ncbi:hypothetical protein LINGRAHAP2_LOCUS22400 [Linum grandiflorum]
MAAPVLVVSADDFVASIHVLNQKFLARFFWESPRTLRLVQSTLKRKWRLTGDLQISSERHELYLLLFSDKSSVGRAWSLPTLLRRPPPCSTTLDGPFDLESSVQNTPLTSYK